MDAPKHLTRMVHARYFSADEPAFQSANLWRLQNSFTGVFKDQLDPVPFYKATASLGEYFESLH